VSAESRNLRPTARLVTLAFIKSGDRVLLMRHPDDNDRFPGQWNGIGGHVERGECIHAAARRELREETGIDLDRLSLRGVVHETGLVGHDHVLFVFVGETDARTVRSPEGLELRWHPMDDLEALLLVHDVALLLPRALAAREPFFAIERYESGDRAASVRIDAEVAPGV
jgi:8-oxo-dGTP pyrophosphatase MutT (NUDIX family)